MIGLPELLDGINTFVSSIFVYLVKSETLMASFNRRCVKKVFSGSRKSRSTADLAYSKVVQILKLGLATTVLKTWTTRASLKDLQNQSNLKLGWIQSEKNSHFWINNRT
jgi:hypothetical protein